MLFFIISFNDTEVTFNFPMRQINEEVIMPNRHMSFEQMYSYL